MSEQPYSALIKLPFPPSNNTYYTVARNRKILSKKGREFKKACRALLQHDLAAISGDVTVCIVMFMPDKRRRDLDNYIKPLLDALTEANIYHDDSQIKLLSVLHGGYRKGGHIEIQVERTDDEEHEDEEAHIIEKEHTCKVIEFPYDRLNPHSD